MDKKISAKYIFVVGFTVFAALFGAGNLIFPPALGLTAGCNWFWGFLAFIVMDAGLSAAALIAGARYEGGFKTLSYDMLGKAGAVLMCMLALCMGPLSCVPRIGSVTYDLAVRPVLPNASCWVVTIIFFAATALLCIRPSKIVDVVGQYLAPALLLALIVLIIVGLCSPSFPIKEGMGFAGSFKKGLSAGYQTMDMLCACILGTVILAGTTELNLTKKDEIRLCTKASLVAGIGLFIVYCGLTFLGAVSGESEALSNSELLLAIVQRILGKPGIILLAVIVVLACITTAITLISACSNIFCDLLKNRIGYKPMVIILCVISCLFSNFGTDAIIKLAEPVLNLVYPAAIVVVLLSFLPKKYCRPTVFRITAVVTVLVALYCVVDGLVPTDLGSSVLPFAALNLAWVIPAAIATGIGMLIVKKKES